MVIHDDGGARENLADSISLDRIIPSEGYVLGNVALLCWRCNAIKRDATPRELANVSRWLLRRTGNEAEKFDRRDEPLETGLWRPQEALAL